MSHGLPFRVHNGQPSFINLLDALSAWQLVREARAVLGVVAATSFKHVSPAGAAIAGSLPENLVRVYDLEKDSLTPAAVAYLRARGGDPRSSYGDFIAISDVVDVVTAKVIKRAVSDGIVAPGYAPGVVDILRSKKKGSYLILEMDPTFAPPERESRELFGVRLVEERDNLLISDHDLVPANGDLPDQARRDLLLGLITIKHTQSNSVGYCYDGQMIGIGAGQQSRIDCTRLAGRKADTWFLLGHPKVRSLPFLPDVPASTRLNWQFRYIEGMDTSAELREFERAVSRPVDPLTPDERDDWLAHADAVAFVSDGYIPFRDNVDEAHRHGVRYIASPAGSLRDDEVADACRAHGITIVHTRRRYFHH